MFSQTCKNAIRAVLYLTVKSSPEQKVGISVIAKDLNISQYFLSKILQRVAKEKIISSTKGPNGGFFMTEENKKGKLKNIINCIDGNGFFVDCSLGLETCNSENPCYFHNSFSKLRDEMIVITNNSFDEMGDIMFDKNNKIIRL
ncbi:MAG: Rrf2 family transcriptional regulator [Candidatus Kapabacteria bacterium]|nr:Rrf2 family transcriptional regulator [Candidatus Kapabacteria bacterium]